MFCINKRVATQAPNNPQRLPAEDKIPGVSVDKRPELEELKFENNCPLLAPAALPHISPWPPKRTYNFKDLSTESLRIPVSPVSCQSQLQGSGQTGEQVRERWGRGAKERTHALSST